MYRKPILSDPANRQHPLLRGMLGWWIGLPAHGGRPTWAGLIRNGLATQQNAAGWSGNTRPGRLGLCPSYTPASSQYTDLSALDAQLDTQPAVTIACWVRRTAGTNCGLVRGPDSPTPKRFGWQWNTNNTIYCFNEPSCASYPNFNASSYTGWVHVAMVFNGALSGYSRLALYLNGRSVGALTAGGDIPAATVTPSTGFAAGRTYPSGVAYATGETDDVAVWSRALSASEIWSWYDQSRRSHPDTLRRVGMAVAFASIPINASFNPWFLPQSSLVGSGVY